MAAGMDDKFLHAEGQGRVGATLDDGLELHGEVDMRVGG